MANILTTAWEIEFQEKQQSKNYVLLPIVHLSVHTTT